LVAKAKFTPIGNILSSEVAFVQAATALDVAGMFAQERHDVEGMSKVASLYIELGVKMMAPGIGEEEDEEELDRKVPLGFSPPPAVTPVKEVELEDESVD